MATVYMPFNHSDSVDTITISEDIANKRWRKHINCDIIYVSEMIDEHLKATISMVERGYDYKGRSVPNDRQLYLPMLREELARRNLYIKESGWDE